MKGESCKTCRYRIDGDCRRYPPTVHLLQTLSAVPQFRNLKPEAVWPPVAEDHWCGEFKPLGGA